MRSKQPTWTITYFAVPLIFTAGASLMFGPSQAAHWAACSAFLVAAVWVGVVGIMGFRGQQRLDWILWVKTFAIGSFVFILCPMMIYFAWPGAAQVPPDGVNGNCNNFGNNNTNCNTFNFAPPPLRLTEKLALDMLSKMPDKKKIIITVIGPGQDNVEFGSKLTGFLRRKGYDADWSYIGNLVPMPKRGTDFQETDREYIWTFVH